MSEIDDIYVVVWNEKALSDLTTGDYVRGYTTDGHFFEGRLTRNPHALPGTEWQLFLDALQKLPQREVTAKLSVEACTTWLDSSDLVDRQAGQPS